MSNLPKMMKISQVPQKTYDMVDISYFCSLGELGFKSGKVVHEIEIRCRTAAVSCVREFLVKFKGKMSGGGGGRKNLRKRPAAGSDEDADTGSAVIQKAKSASVGPLVASTAKPKKREDAFYESARTAVPSIGKDNGATAPIIDEEEGLIGSKPAGIQVQSNSSGPQNGFVLS